MSNLPRRVIVIECWDGRGSEARSDNRPKKSTGKGGNNEARYTTKRLQKITRYIFKRSRDNFIKFYPDQLITYRSRLTLGKDIAIGIARESQTANRGGPERDDPVSTHTIIDLSRTEDPTEGWLAIFLKHTRDRVTRHTSHLNTQICHR